MTSNPPIPHSPSPDPSPTDANDADNLDPYRDNGLRLEKAPFHLEKIHDYEKDGHRPVHLGDLYGPPNNSERYKVIHKLGSGGFANVWLCRDTETSEPTTYVALKILMAEVSGGDCEELVVMDRLKGLREREREKEGEVEENGAEFICMPSESFRIKGGNGEHLVFVYPVSGPDVSLGLFGGSEDKDGDRTLRDLCMQVTKAVAYLHGKGICHGDITPKNILRRITGLGGLTEEEILKILGTPELNPVLDDSGSQYHGPNGPEYLVYPVIWDHVPTHHILPSISLIDFGEAFEVSKLPENLGIPGPYRAPELILEKKIGVRSDIWALGCTLFEIRTGRKLFAPFDDEDDDYLYEFVNVLGKMPEPWWSDTWGVERKKWFLDDVDEMGRAVSTVPKKDEVVEEEGENKRMKSTVHPAFAEEARSLEDKLKPGLWYIEGAWGTGQMHREIEERERVIFADLLTQLLQYRPEDRISAEEAMKHEWFRT